MTFSKKLQYAGSAPYAPERERDDIDHDEYELLTQDETYQRLAEVRYLVDELESQLSGEAVPQATKDALFGMIGVRDAPLQEAVDAYVEQWLAQYRSGGDE